MASALIEHLTDEDIEALAERLKEARPLNIDDIPMSKVIAKLEQQWQPDSSNILNPIAVSEATLAGFNIQSLTTAAIAVGGEQNVAVNHGLDTTPRGVIAWLEDGTWASQLSWRVLRDATVVRFYVSNPGPNVATGIVKFIIIP